MSSYEKISYELKGDVAIIAFDDASTLNACGIDTAIELLHAFETAGEQARCTILTGNGRGFCSGANLSSSPGGAGSTISHKDAKPDAGRSLDAFYNPLIKQIRNHPHPVITAVNGAAAGIGCSLGLIGDLVLCGKSGYFLQAFRRIGLVPDGGSSYILARTVGRVRAMEMALLGEKLPAEKALEWGLVNRVIEDDKLMDEALALATQIAEGPTIALSLMRKQIWDACDEDLNSSLESERVHQRTAGRSRDFAEGVRAFLEKRPAQFKGE